VSRPEDIELADEIMRFLEKHANSSASYDPEYDEPGDRYSSPDASELHIAAERLRHGMGVERVPWSSWGSGGYAPYSDNQARAWHDQLVEKIGARIVHTPSVSR
jgi:hypothetical protein